MIIVEHTEDRCSLSRPNASPDVAASLIETSGNVRISA